MENKENHLIFFKGEPDTDWPYSYGLTPTYLTMENQGSQIKV